MKHTLALCLLTITFYMADGRIKQYDETYQVEHTAVTGGEYSTSTPVVKGREYSKFRQFGSTDITVIDQPISYYLVSKDGTLEDIYPDFVVKSVV